MNKEMINEFPERNVTIDFTDGKAKSLIKIGYIRIYLANHFNWLQKKMWKMLLNVEIEDIKENK